MSKVLLIICLKLDKYQKCGNIISQTLLVIIYILLIKSLARINKNHFLFEQMV